MSGAPSRLPRDAWVRTVLGLELPRSGDAAPPVAELQPNIGGQPDGRDSIGQRREQWQTTFEACSTQIASLKPLLQQNIRDIKRDDLLPEFEASWDVLERELSAVSDTIAAAFGQHPKDGTDKDGLLLAVAEASRLLDASTILQHLDGNGLQPTTIVELLREEFEEMRRSC